MGRDDLNDLSREKLEDLVCEWAIRYHELDSKMHTLENELNNRIKTQREKINSLQMELEEEKGKTITVFDGGITMRADIWRIVDENKSLRDENKALKQRIKDLEDICDGSCFANETDDRDEKIAKMQDRIDSDCVRINRLKVTINTLVDMYGLLRNQVGMD